MKQKDIEHRARQIAWPAPSPSLRARVLSAADVARQPVTWSDRMWYSRGWRWSAAASALVVVALEYLSGSSRPAALASSPQVQAEVRFVEEVGRQAGLPPDAAASLAWRAVSEASTSRTSSAALQAFDLDGIGDGR